ncbi:uncharacterized protein A1O5_00786 [Cladophialophora psammophila CBS 110553]|uniref:Cytochrome P450 oxidoreductase n=1 Tax=Cladophialophora psammophila CBS 110553 TaxID=1182543 RepID=W9X7R5_9EURO|nr:uncharacterized protein A1O5_00786 [Cladophialophora psammophila CBS 110553]EXJ76278.1 hypothetical protein A1O5_00786 [Cladophialophora psammophila CBS 110553]
MGLSQDVAGRLLSPLPSSATLVLGAVLIVGYAIYSYITYDPRLKSLPPGPRGYPFIGSLLSLADPNKVPEISREWAHQYGELVHTKIGGTRFMWLNSPRVVKDLMDKRGTKYSGRPYAPMVDNVSGKARTFFMNYGERWRSVRRVSHACLNLTASNSYRPVQDFESKQVLHDYLNNKDPGKFYDDNRRYAASLIMTITYGRRVANWNDPHIERIFTVLKHFVAMATPGAWLVDAFPSLQYLPSWMVQNWWKIGREWFAYDSKVYLDLYRNLIKQVEEGTAPDCFVKDFYLSNPSKNGIDELMAAYAAGSLVEAGSESTSSVINAWLRACIQFPETVRAAQEEVDRVVGPDRLPTFDDEPNLPYIRAMAKEILRLVPITKFGTPHATTEDDWYEGYFIPKGSVVMLNWWAIHFDPKIRQNPFTYDPSRFLHDPYSTAEAVNAANPNDRDHYAYGAGRRICTGLHVAQNSLFINMARTVWAFNMHKYKEPTTGKVEEPDMTAENGFLCIPKPFKMVFEPRSPEKAMTIEREWTLAESQGIEWTRKQAKL